ncbi:MAG: pyrroline-5-carboxylate reductase [Caulobacter sp.]|nr:pyrroline-5-carboxylate reductase [Caulobacter sp.]
MDPRTVLLVGAGRMGGAMIEGWRVAGPVSMDELIVRDPHPSPEARRASEYGAVLDPADADLGRAATVVLAVKPQLWRQVAAEIEPFLAPDAIIVSVAAGVAGADIAAALGGRLVARVMPTTAVAIGQGAVTIHSDSDEARARAHALFATLGSVVDVEDEALMHAATAVSGSGPAYLYAFVEALEAAGVKAGVPAADAATLARATVSGAAALMAAGDTPPAELRRQVTSPGGTTAAGLEVLTGSGDLQQLLAETVAAAVRRSKELG